jgi:catechol 2,3-dioxygenase-like lactoylglutathione lyase family enzyme
MLRVTQALIHADLVVKSIDQSIDFLKHFLDVTIYDDVVVDGELPVFLSQNRASRMRLVLLRFSPVGAMLELMEFLDASPDIAEHVNTNRVSLSILVSDLQEVIARARSHGIEPQSDVFTVAMPKAGSHQIVFFRDPNGFLIEIVGKRGLPPVS